MSKELLPIVAYAMFDIEPCVALTAHANATAEIAKRDMEINILRDQLEQYQKDAERYRWLRQYGTLESVFTGTIQEREVWIDRARLDAAIDAAREEE